MYKYIFYITCYISFMLPLLLIASWTLAIDPFLEWVGPGPHVLVPLRLPRPFCKRPRPPHIGWGIGPGPGPIHAKIGSIARVHKGINSKGNIIDIQYFV